MSQQSSKQFLLYALLLGGLIAPGCASGGGGGGGDEDSGGNFPVIVGATDDDEVAEDFSDSSLLGFSTCATSDVSENTLSQLSPLLDSFLSSRAAAGESVSSTHRDVNIPVVFHVISKGPGAEDGEVADSQLAAQIDVLNARFSGSDGSLPTPYRFQLSAINRVRNPDWYTIAPGSDQELDAKNALHVGGPETLNIYTANTENGILGFATFPYFYGIFPSQDGIVINFRALPAGPTQRYSTGNVVVHEAGHWLGLLHTFQGECSSNFGDLIGDTPAEKQPQQGEFCPTGRDSCPDLEGLDPIHNHMTYTEDTCRQGFTKGQLDLMRFANIFFRNFEL